MIEQARALVEKQVGRVRLRLFMQVAVQSVILCGAIGLLLATIWFLVRPFAFADADDAVRWSVPAGLMFVSMLAGMVLGWLRRPNLVNSSLALDERFGLQERVTTFLTLTDDQLASPAGKALVNDVKAHLAKLQIAGAFPLQVRWQQLLMPAGAFTLALLAFLLDPLLGDFKFSSTANADSPRANVDVGKVQEELDKLKKNVAQRSKEESVKSEDLKKMEEEFAKLLNQPLDPKNEDKIKERINEFRKLEDKMKERMEGIKEKAEKIDALKKQLEKLGLEKDNLVKDGPAKDFQDALMKGDLDKAKVALENLAKDLKNNKLDDKQRKELAEQFKKLQEQLKNVANEDQFMKKLKQDLKDGKISKDDFAREMQNFKHLQELTDILGEAKDVLGQGSGKEAGEKLDKLLNQFNEIELTEAEIRDLLRDQGEVGNALDLLEDALGDEEGDGMGGNGRPGRRRRADPNDPNSKIRDERSRAEANPKGAQRVTGYARGGTFNKIPAQAVEGAFKQAAQEAPEALDRQRIPDDAREITAEYFRRIGNQK